MIDREQALLQCSQQLHRAKTRAAQLQAERDALLTVAKELQESAAYWSEYDVPLGIVDRLNAAIAKVTP